MNVGQVSHRKWKFQVAERRQRTGSISREFTDSVLAVTGLGPAVVDVLGLLCVTVVSHSTILTGGATGGEVGSLLYAGQQ